MASSVQEILLDSSPSWVLPGVSLDYDFSHARYFQQGASNSISDLVTCTRASVGYIDYLDGTWGAVAANLPRISDKGLLVEESRTNSIRNNSMQGASAGNSTELITNGTFTGTSGTGWTVVLNAGTGNVDFSVTGQATVTGDGTHQTNLTQSITTVIGRTYAITFSVASAAVFVQVGNSQGNSGLAGVTALVGANQVVTFTATATTTFIGFAVTNAVSPVISNVSTKLAGVLPTNWVAPSQAGIGITSIVAVGTQNGVDYVDITVSGTSSAGGTFGIQMEAGSTIAALQNQVWIISAFLSVAAGATTGLTGLYLDINEQSAGGSFLNGHINPTVLSSINSILTRYPSTGVTLTNASTAFIYPTLNFQFNSAAVISITLRIGWPQLELGAFATSPIRTTSAAVTRATDVITAVNTPTFGGSYTFFAQATPFGTNSVNPLVNVTDGTSNNYLDIYWNGASGQMRFGGRTRSGNTDQVNQSFSGTNTWLVNTMQKGILAATAGDQAGVMTGQALSTATAASMPVGVNSIGIGTLLGAGTVSNGYINRIAIWPTTRLPNATLVALTT